MWLNNFGITLVFTSDRICVYNILVEEVAILVAEVLSSGKYTAEWDASGLASGVYLYRLQAGEFDEIRKLTLLK